VQKEPVIVQSIITAICAGFAPVFVKWGIDSNAAAGTLATAWAVLVGVWSVKNARSKVTPVALINPDQVDKATPVAPPAVPVAPPA
jgi:hypothetical protein